MGIVKINNRGNINIPRMAIQSFLTLEEYNQSTKPKFKGAMVLAPNQRKQRRRYILISRYES